MLSKGTEHQTVPLSVLLKCELANQKTEKPEICHTQFNQSKKGEDFTFVKTLCQRVLGDGVTTYSVFGLFDGHNGTAAAIYTKENLLQNVLSAIPPELKEMNGLQHCLGLWLQDLSKQIKIFKKEHKLQGQQSHLS